MFRLARTVFGRSNAIFSQAVIPSGVIHANALRQIPERGFKAFSVLPVQSLATVPNAVKHLCLPKINSSSPIALNQLDSVPVRTVIQWSYKSGKRKTVKSVVLRFFRLHWGGWIRTRCGRHKKMFKKKGNLKRRLRQHVLVNATQATLLDKMVTKFWKRPKHYIDDIYAPYHERTYYFASKKPMPYPEHPLKSPKTFLELSKGKYT